MTTVSVSKLSWTRTITFLVLFFAVSTVSFVPHIATAQETKPPATNNSTNNPDLVNVAVDCGALLIINPLGCVSSLSGGQSTTETITSGTGHVAALVVLAPVAVISFLILSLASGLLWLAGVIFNWAIVVLVFQFATYLGNSAGMLLAWGILRDFGNIVLLFGFVYMGIQTILQVGHFSVGRTLSRLIIFAVLLNFSLFIAEAIIDTSNVLASTLYSQSYAASANSQPCAVGSTGLSDCQINDGIASVVLSRSGIATVFSSNSSFVNDLGSYLTNPVGLTLKYLLMAMLVTVAAVVLFAAAFLLISRAIHLAFLMVVSPIGFAGMAVPWLEKMAKDWWDALVKQAMFAPVFLILLFVGLKLTEGLDTVLGNNVASAFNASGALQTGPVILFILIIGFMIAALLAAKQFGIYGADAITKTATGIIGRTAGATTFGSVGFVARRTVGFGASRVASAIRSSQWARNNQNIARVLAGGADKVAGSSFDGRSSLKGLDIGKPDDISKKGYAGIKKAATEDRDKFAQSLELSKEEEKEKSAREAAIKKAEESNRGLGVTQRAELATLDKDHQDKRDTEQQKIDVRNAQMKGERAPQEQAVRDAEVAVAQAGADPLARAAAEGELVKARHALEAIQETQKDERDVMKAGFDKLAKAQAQERSAKQREHQDDRDTHEESLRLQRESLKNLKNKPQEDYAKSLKRSTFYPPGSVGTSADKAAAHKISARLKEDDVAKLRREIKSLNTGGGGGGAGSSSASGGGSGAKKPASSGSGAH